MLRRVLASAAVLQPAVPEAVLVGGSAAAYCTGHRDSFDHDHVLADLAERRAGARGDGGDRQWSDQRARQPPADELARLPRWRGGRAAAAAPDLTLEVSEVELSGAWTVRVPTLPDMFRVKAYLVVQRNQTRDYLDVAALSDRMGMAPTIGVLLGLNDYYRDRCELDDSILTAIVQRLFEPRPRSPG